MKKFLFWFFVVCCLLGNSPLLAQTPSKITRGVVKGVGKKMPATPKVKAPPKVKVPTPQVSPRVANGSAAALPKTVSGTSAIPPATATTLAPISQEIITGVGVSRRELEAQLESLLDKRQEAEQNQLLLMFNSGIGRSVVFAPLMSSEQLGYSVTIFKLEYEGTTEMFGVLPSHALPYDTGHYADSVSKNFSVKIKLPNGLTASLPASVVQISPQSMLDISLVKFEPQAEELLAPLRLSEHAASMNERLFSYGYAAGKETQIARTVNAQSFISVRTNQAIEGDREGFCGSPLLDLNGDVKAIHTGTVERKNAEDVSYGTHVSFIRKLVQAYHNNGQAPYDIILNGHAIANINIDEYISAIYLYNAEGKKIFQKNIDGKFSETLILNAVKENPSATYLQLTSRRATWVEETGDRHILQENRTRLDKTKRQHWYNLTTKQMEPVRPAVIKV